MKLRERIIKALIKRDGIITKSQVTRLFDRIKDGSETLELKMMKEEGLINIVVRIQKEKTGLNPTIYELTKAGKKYFKDFIQA